MPTPLPTLASSLSAVTLFADCIRKRDPALTPNPTFPFVPPNIDFDQELYELFGSGNKADAKRQWSIDDLPFRSILCEAANGKLGVDAYNELIAHPDLYWPSVQWGYANFGGAAPGGTTYDFTSVIGTYTSSTVGYLGSLSYWEASSHTGAVNPGDPLVEGGGTGSPSGSVSKAVFVTQILCPQLWTPKSYEIWKVTVLWGVQANYGGSIPSPNIWSSSSDFAFVSSGTINPGDTLVIPAHDTDPVANCQTPPAPPSTTVPPNTNDAQHWLGWGVLNYIYFP